MNKYKIAVLISLFVIISDQIAKWLIIANVALFDKIPVLPFFDITHIRNQGAAFGILNSVSEGVRMPLFALVLIVAIIAIFTFLRTTDDRHKLLVTALSLILGGAIGNSIDRFRFGYVTDFIDVHWFGDPNYHWPAFNIADSAITIGVILVLFDTFFVKKDK